MKTTSYILLLTVSLMLPALAGADTLGTKNKKTDKAVAVQAVPAKQHVIYYMTQEKRTGSNIPVTYRSYNGRIDSASNPAVYGQSDLRRTGALDVATELYMVDPSFTSRRH